MRPQYRRALVAVLVTLFCAPPTLAQLAKLAKTTPEERARVQTEFMKQKLDLAPEQLEKIEKINLAMATDAQPILEGDGATFAKALKLRKLDANRDRKLKALLSHEQFERFKDAKGELRNTMAEHFGSTTRSGDP